MASWRLSPQHDADTRALSETLARGAIGLRIGLDMQPVGAEPLGKAGVAFDQAGKPARLHEIDQASGMIFVDRRAVAAKQNAGRIGGGR